MEYIKLMRPHQWIKNVFCFAGVFFGAQFTFPSLYLAMLGFIAFCFASSAMYILNDIYDIKNDKLHPQKKYRAIASGKISIVKGLLFSAILMITSCVLSYIISWIALLIVLVYFVLTFLYSLKLKHVVIVDVFIISFGFLLRLLMGSLAINIQPSKWIILCTIMITLLLGFAKRKSELLTITDGNITRRVLNDYSHLMLDIFLSIMAACSIMSYSLFVVLGSSYQNIWITVPFVIFALLRYIYMLLLLDGGQDTSKDIFQDYPILISCILFVASYAFVITYLK